MPFPVSSSDPAPRIDAPHVGPWGVPGKGGAALADIARLRSHAMFSQMLDTARDDSDKPAPRAIPDGDAAALHERQVDPATKGKASRPGAPRDRVKRVMCRSDLRPEKIRQPIAIAYVPSSFRAIGRTPGTSPAVDNVSRCILNELTPQLQSASWTPDGLEAVVAGAAEPHGHGLGKLAGPLRTAPAGRTVTPSVFEMMRVIGREETPCAHR